MRLFGMEESRFVKKKVLFNKKDLLYFKVQFRLINRHSMAEHNEYTYLSSPFFFLHIINAYEDEDHIIIDVCCYDNPDMLKCMTIEALEVFLYPIRAVFFS